MNRSYERHDLEPHYYRDRWSENDDRARSFAGNDDFRDDLRRASMMRYRGEDDRIRRNERGYGVRGGDRDRFQDPMGYSRESEGGFRSQGGYGAFGEGYRGHDERGFFRGQDFYRGPDRGLYRGPEDRGFYRAHEDRAPFRWPDDRSYDDGDGGSSRPYGGGYGVPHRDAWQGYGSSMRGYGSRQDEGRGEGYSRGGRGKGPKNFTRSDERVREDVCLLLEESDVDASDIEVRVSNGDVLLEGAVDSRWAKREVEDIVSCIRGVRDCHNQLRVMPHDESSHAMHPAGSNGGRSSSAAGRSPEQRRSASS